MLRFASHSAGSHRTYRLVRQLHLWIGAWGALAAIAYGFTGLLLNHRSGDRAWPQGESVESPRVVLHVPAGARVDAESLSLWLRRSQHLDATSIRKGGPGGQASSKWNFGGGTARESWSIEYEPGADTAQLRRSRQDTLAAVIRLHKAVGGGWAWRLLADTFAIGMLLLGLSGLWMWARGRTARQMAFSVVGLGAVLMAMILLPAML
jgi:hypothetical protein